jgi:hypothetical protein
MPRPPKDEQGEWTLAPERRARVYIVGAAGSGKTTLAGQLGARLGCPVAHLDRVFFAPGGIGAAGARDAAIAAWAALPGWVVDGAYPAWVEEFAAACDLVVWLDMPFRTVAWRILRRHLLANLRGDNPHRGWRRLRRFLGDVYAYYRRPAAGAGASRYAAASLSRAGVAAGSAGHTPKLLRVGSGRPGGVLATVLARLDRPELAKADPLR